MKRSNDSKPAGEVRIPLRHEGQERVASSPARFKVAICGRRWGKTVCGVSIVLEQALKGARCWWVAPNAATSEIAWRMARHFAAGDPTVEIVRGDRTLLFAGGGEIWFKSAGSFLRGEGIDYLVLDEADYLDESLWTDDLRPSLADRKGGALFISTPRLEGGWLHRIVQRAQSGEPGWEAFRFPSVANPLLDPEEIEAARRDIPSLEFRREFEAEFVSARGARIRREWLRYAEPPPGLALAMGVDLAIGTREDADYTAAALLARDPLGTVYVVHVERVRSSFAGVLRFVQSLAERFRPFTIAIEQVQFQAAVVQELLRTTDLPARGLRPESDKVTRFAPLEARYEQGLVVHAPALPHEFERELLSFPLGDHDDMVDALSLAWRALSHRGYSFA